MMEVVGYASKEQRDRRYRQLKEGGTTSAVRFSELERIGDPPIFSKTEVRKLRMWFSRKPRHTVRVSLRPEKSKWREVWCVAWSSRREPSKTVVGRRGL